jgi:hypothetical protein
MTKEQSMSERKKAKEKGKCYKVSTLFPLPMLSLGPFLHYTFSSQIYNQALLHSPMYTLIFSHSFMRALFHRDNEK